MIAGLSRTTGVHLAEVGFLLITVAGLWLAASAIPRFGMGRFRTVVSGLLLFAAGVLLIIATRAGHFG